MQVDRGHFKESPPAINPRKPGSSVNHLQHQLPQHQLQKPKL